jgi:hypothetical protein
MIFHQTRVKGSALCQALAWAGDLTGGSRRRRAATIAALAATTAMA